ncbi:MAG: divalent-cation tolerance protein CutA [Myxococcales bacterium]|nr:divalent-cation tolerance protein CutA [Myxococcales bacterium]
MPQRQEEEEHALRVVYCSCPRTEARRLARVIVEQRVGACVQILPSIESVYHWKGEICEDEEALLLIKTERSVLERLTEVILAHHPYSVPEVVAVPVKAGECNEGYRAWLLKELGKVEEAAG